MKDNMNDLVVVEVGLSLGSDGRAEAPEREILISMNVIVMRLL